MLGVDGIPCDKIGWLVVLMIGITWTYENRIYHSRESSQTILIRVNFIDNDSIAGRW